MKKNSLILISFTLFFNCKVNEKPIFISIENINVINANPENITLSANALFNNPNDVGGTLETENLKIFVNKNEIAQFKAKTFKVPKKKEFSIPLVVTVSTDSVFGRKNLGGLLGSLISKQLEVTYNGKINYNVFGFSSSYLIDKSQNVKINF